MRDPSIMYNLTRRRARPRSRTARVSTYGRRAARLHRWRAALVNHPAIFAIVVAKGDYVPDYGVYGVGDVDAAKAGDRSCRRRPPHGVTWSLPLSPDDVSGPRQISIPVSIPFIVGNFRPLDLSSRPSPSVSV